MVGYYSPPCEPQNSQPQDSSSKRGIVPNIVAGWLRRIQPAGPAVATFKPSAFNSQGVEPNASDPIFRAIGAYMAPGDPPPVKK